MYIKENVKQLVGMVLIIFSIFIANGCKSDMQITSPGTTTTGGQTAKNSIISGQVINSNTGIPVDSAFVQIIGTSIYQTAYTNSQGKYSAIVSLTSNTNLIIYVSKTGFIQDTTAINVTYGVDYSASLISISSSTGTQKPSGNPVSIYLSSQSTTNIGVQSSGSVETATLTFVAVDSSGTPIDLNHSVSVAFSFGQHPGGGEQFSPAVVTTNDQGEASVNITSGTKAGTVQIYAEIDIGTKKIYSMPVAITIFGGLPDQAHFSIAPANVNFPGYDIYGLTDVINAYVGDKYGNPVRVGTSIYFTSTGGIIGGSAETNDQGIGTINLLSAAPQPTDATKGPGFALITASTADANKNTIQSSVYVLFSGSTQITNINPKSFSIPNGGSQTFSYSVSDENGNPLASGTNITVNAAGTNVAAQGDISVTLPDTQSKTWTNFAFLVFDTNDTVNVANPCTITIQVSSPNGNEQTTIIGTSH